LAGKIRAAGLFDERFPALKDGVDGWEVGRSPVQVAQFVFVAPFEQVVFKGDWHSVEHAAGVDIEDDFDLRLFVGAGSDEVADLGGDPEFFEKFARQGLLGGFVGFEFSAWKFPCAWQGHGRGPAGAKKQAVVEDCGANDVNLFHLGPNEKRTVRSW
jgi:hypothetical protein